MNNNSEFFDQILPIEILKSEIKRATFLAYSFLFLTLIIFFSSAFVPEKLPPRFFDDVGGLELRILSIGLLSFFTIYEFFQTWLLKQYLKNKKVIPEVYRYISAIIEISFPTFSIFVFSKVIDIPIYGLHLPQVFFYFIFILLSCLRLSATLCLFTSLIAAIEFGILSRFLLRNSLEMDVSPIFKNIGIIATKNIFLVFGAPIKKFALVFWTDEK